MAKRKKEAVEQNFINKNKYNDIKRMDHMQMNGYINGVRKVEYEKGYKIGRVDGYEAGRSEAENRINTLAETDFKNLDTKIKSVKGIGTVKATEIMKIIREVLENEETDKKKPH